MDGARQDAKLERQIEALNAKQRNLDFGRQRPRRFLKRQMTWPAIQKES